MVLERGLGMSSHVVEIREFIQLLVAPIRTTEGERLGYDPSYDSLRTVSHPSLVEQLRRAISGGAGHPSGGSSSFGSRPPIRLEALDFLTRIEQESAAWVRALEGEPRSSAEGHLWWLSGALPDLDVDDLADLHHDVRSWRIGAAIAAGWDAAPWRPHVPCINCNEVGTLRVKAEPSGGGIGYSGWSVSAYCVDCGEAWDSSTIGLLGLHIEAMMNAPTPARLSVDVATIGERPPAEIPRVLAGLTAARTASSRVTKPEDQSA